jgi:hypothetical protein
MYDNLVIVEIYLRWLKKRKKKFSYLLVQLYTSHIGINRETLNDRSDFVTS